MNKISLSEIDDIRKQGFRPVVVGCFVNEEKVLFLYHKEYDLWQLPQGGIENGENVDQAVNREMSEELGSDFVQTIESSEIVGDDELIFPSATQGSRDLKTDDGDEVYMKGKKYFFVLINSAQREIEIRETEFNDYRWLSYPEAITLCHRIYQKGKQRITLSALNKLKEFGSIK